MLLITVFTLQLDVKTPAVKKVCILCPVFDFKTPHNHISVSIHSHNLLIVDKHLNNQDVHWAGHLIAE